MKTAMRHHLTRVRMAIIKKTKSKKCWRSWTGKGTLIHCWWECKLVQPLWKIVLMFLRKLKVKLPYDPAILLLGIQSSKTINQKDTCTCVFIAALYAIAKTWKQLNVHWQMNDKENVAHIYRGMLVSHAKE